MVANSLPFTYTWTRKGKIGLKKNNTNETVVTVIYSGDIFRLYRDNRP